MLFKGTHVTRRSGEAVVVTGDQPLTARSIARAVHLIADDDHEVFTGQDIERLRRAPAELRTAKVFARVTPTQKARRVGVRHERSTADSAVAARGSRLLRNDVWASRRRSSDSYC